MPHEEPPILPRRKPKITRYLAAAILSLIAVFFVQLCGPNTPIVISRQTTYITSPLRADGLPDYSKYYRDRFATRISPAENAAALLWQAIEPKYLSGKEQSLMCQELGLPTSIYTNRIQPFDDESFDEELWYWYSDKFNAATFVTPEYPNGDACQRIRELAQVRPWKRSDVPPFATWLDDHQTQIELIRAAGDNASLYLPSLELLQAPETPLLNVWPNSALALSDGAIKGLALRAMYRLGEGRCEHSWSDILAIYRLATLLHQGHSTYELERGLVLEDAAYQATVAFLQSPHVTREQSDRAIRDVAALPPLASLAPYFDQLGRIRALDAILQLHLGHSEKLLESLELGDQVQALDYISVDWNFVMMEANRWFDRFVAAFSQPDYPSQSQAIAAIYRDLNQAGNRFQNAADLARVTFSRSERNEFLAVAAVSMMLDLPPLQEQARAKAHRAMVPIICALERYRREHQTYPNVLLELVPDFLASLPTDAYSNGPFLYQRGGVNCLLYSAGENGADDGGSHDPADIFAGQALNWNNDPATEALRKKIPPGADDEVILRLPTPPFQITAPPPPTQP